MEKQLDDLAKQLDKVSNQENLKKQLEQAGLKKEDIDRMLQHLSKDDLDQLKKQLQKNGMSQQQISKIAQQVKKQQGAAQALKNMSKAMKSAAQAAGDGQMGDAMAGMELANDQLSEMEQLEQEMNQLQSTMSQLNQARGQCQGQGQGQGKQGQGNKPGGMGKLGQGKGGLAQSSPTDVGFKVERGKVKTTKGRIIGQFLVDGEQVRGEGTDDFVELITAAERDATDTVNRDRLPRQYQKSVRDYFSRLPSDFKLKTQKGPDADAGSGTPATGDTDGGEDAASNTETTTGNE
jgi:hypothetical protein